MPFHIIRNDITKVKADAIVNTANPGPVFARGTDSALYRTAGEEALLAERRKIGEIPVGDAAVTPAFGLDARYIIHTAEPVWQGGGQGEADAVRLCYRNSLRLAREHDCESIAFTMISTGVYGFPKGEELQVALSEIRDFLLEEDMMVWLVVFDRESFDLSEMLFSDIDSYIDDHYVADRMSEEYGAAYAGADISLPFEADSGPFRENGKDVFGRQRKGEEVPPLPQQAAAAGSLSRLPEEPSKPNLPKPNLPKPNLPKPNLRKPSPPGLFPGTRKWMAQERSLEDVVAHLGETFQQRLFRLIDERGMKDVEVYKKANLDRKLFSKIRCNADYRPKKITAVALAMALELNLDETKDLLSRAEMALSPSSKFDLIITYFIEREFYDIYTVNIALFQHEQPLLGA